ncbi:nucleotidyltransferase domain-containing protein [Asticcacaulis sp. BYS171W]|uniref:Nucleotidyltransferase domain-containing protein n=1 Tax=Asticcacaulis aquaticus TaxID=2984212 RepID=A0ABT5HVG9_9CAUL|nr:nucleotidyltransferase domain-containing protein [Asticcacaulis aquaticus]MDC7684072.1 nucleotidyltransferase domain-containing protein [Asticcacaulis aquaticus]
MSGYDALIETLNNLAPDMRRKGVAHLFLFGSHARNEASADSDVDLFLDFDDPRFNLFDLMDVKRLVEDQTGRSVDLMTRNSLHPRFRSDIERSAIQVF